MHTFHLSSTHFRLSRHAVARMQQRSIPAFVIDLLLEWADPVDVGYGAEKFSFNDDSWAEALRAMGNRASKLHRYRNAYVVVASNGTISTAARQH